MSDDKNGEVLAAEVLRRALEGERVDVGDEEGEILDVAQRIQAAAGRAAPLDDSVKAALLDAALQRAPGPPQVATVAPIRSRSWLRWGAAAMAAAVAVLVMGSLMMLSQLRIWTDSSSVVVRLEAPAEALSAPTDAVFDGPFPEEQSAAERMDQILAARTRGYFSALAARSGGGSERAGTTAASGVRVAAAKRWAQ